MELFTEALDVAHTLGNVVGEVGTKGSIAQTLLLTGKVEVATKVLWDLIPQVQDINEAWCWIGHADMCAAALAEVGEPHLAVRLMGSADATRERLGLPRDPREQAQLAELMTKTRTNLTVQEWTEAYQAGRNTTVEDALTEAHAAAPQYPTACQSPATNSPWAHLGNDGCRTAMPEGCPTVADSRLV
jgi:hypothetical protein